LGSDPRTVPGSDPNVSKIGRVYRKPAASQQNECHANPQTLNLLTPIGLSD